ncbi:MAG TPA: hypothetical protein VN257_03045, partial [Actinotalea sp.]|nr:hypothetical protein [Actinotalea sp.]
MLHRVIASLLCLLGAAALGLGIASATLWRADDTLVASAEATTFLATEAGVLDLAADEVTVRAVSAGAEVVVALGRTADVEAWLGADAQTWVTGLTDWSTLSTREVAATTPEETPTPSPSPSATADPTPAPSPSVEPEAAPSPGADPRGSDLWVTEVSADGEAVLQWERQDGRWSVLVAGLGAEAGPVTLELSWPQEVTTPWLAPGVVIGALLLVAGVLWWVVLLWGTRWLGPVGAVAGTWTARLLGRTRSQEASAAPARPRTVEVPVVGDPDREDAV